MRLMQLGNMTSLLSDLKDSAVQLTDGQADQSEEIGSNVIDQNKNGHTSVNGKAGSDNGGKLTIWSVSKLACQYS